jgi:hypothetical protein
MANKASQRDAAIQKNLFRTLLLIAIGLVALAGLVLYRVITKK